MRAASQEGSLLVGKVWPRGDRVGWWGMSVLALFKGFSGPISMKLFSRKDKITILYLNFWYSTFIRHNSRTLINLLPYEDFLCNCRLSIISTGTSSKCDMSEAATHFHLCTTHHK